MRGRDPGGDVAETVVVDSSALVDLLIDPGAGGRAVADRLRGCALVAPDLLFAETANVLRKLRHRGVLSDAEASMAFAELMELPIESWPFETLAERVWMLRSSVTSYDATFLALAELLAAPLVTRDARMVRAANGLARAPEGRGAPVEVVDR